MLYFGSNLYKNWFVFGMETFSFVLPKLGKIFHIYVTFTKYEIFSVLVLISVCVPTSSFFIKLTQLFLKCLFLRSSDFCMSNILILSYLLHLIYYIICQIC